VTGAPAGNPREWGKIVSRQSVRRAPTTGALWDERSVKLAVFAERGFGVEIFYGCLPADF